MTQIRDYRIGFVGFGHLAEAIFQAIDRTKLIPRSQILFTRKDKDRSLKTEKKYGITATSLSHLAETSDLLFLLVRPHQAPTIYKDLAHLKNTKYTAIISCMAGIPLSTLQSHFPGKQIARALPNLGAAVQQGMTVLSFAPNSSIDFQSVTHLLLSSFGKILEIPEPLMNLCTGLSGSGIAFAVHLIDAAARYGASHGLTYEQSLLLSAQTFKGAADLVLSHHALPQDLLQQIATPNGTTEAGLTHLTHSPAALHLQEAIAAAAKRAAELTSPSLN